MKKLMKKLIKKIVIITLIIFIYTILLQWLISTNSILLVSLGFLIIIFTILYLIERYIS